VQEKTSRAYTGVSPSHHRAPAAAGGPALALFIAASFLSAFLLFSVEPLFAKMVLPVLGGSPSVWAVALCFFQAALLAGYAYAYVLMRYVPAQWTGFVQIAVALAALLVLPIGLPSGWSEPPPGEPYVWQLGLFAVAVGLPFVAVAANAPLLQAWFALTGHPHARDPYFLYGASNFGSLIALLGFPFVFEPALGLKAMSRDWTALYVLLIAALAACFVAVRRYAAARAQVTERGEPEASAPRPTWRARLGWCGLALVPAALLTAFTTHIATDVASAPLLWVLPLAVYLATFILAFQDRVPVPMPLLLPLQLASVIFALFELAQLKYDKWTLTSSAGVAVFFLSALLAHRTLYLSRPRERDLTEFYLWMSLGGVLGGLFSALIAPKIFSEVFEYPLLIALTFACRPGVFGRHAAWKREALWLLGIVGVGLLPVLYGEGWAARLGLSFGEWGPTAALTLALGTLLVAFWGQGARQLAVALLMFAAVVMLPSTVRRGTAQRSYFGVYRVSLSDDGDYNVLTHGTTLHGAQRIRDDDGNLVTDMTPVTYYYRGSPLQRSVEIVQQRLDKKGGKGRFGVVGLGTGSISCYAQKDERWRFFEIDPVVIDIAAKSTYFTFLANCQPKLDVVLGDARLTLAKEPERSFDYMLIDAFSSDAIPVHLMTAEALQLYAAKLKDDGILVLHISNRYLDLDSVLGATMPLVPQLKGLIVSDDKSDGYAENGSTIAVFAKDERALDAFRLIEGSGPFNASRLSPWTDDASDILGPFLSQWRRTS
jgi:SAM-dependent methyltransferase